jgi:hypothetical protein
MAGSRFDNGAMFGPRHSLLLSPSDDSGNRVSNPTLKGVTNPADRTAYGTFLRQKGIGYKTVAQADELSY